MKGFYYTVFILGYDLLNIYFKNSEECECDLAFEKCEKIAQDFEKSKYNVPTEGLYECLKKYVDDNLQEILLKIK